MISLDLSLQELNLLSSLLSPAVRQLRGAVAEFDLCDAPVPAPLQEMRNTAMELRETFDCILGVVHNGPTPWPVELVTDNDEVSFTDDDLSTLIQGQVTLARSYPHARGHADGLVRRLQGMLGIEPIGLAFAA